MPLPGGSGNFLPMQFREQITIGIIFSMFAYGAILGTLQIAAARHRFSGLSLLGTRNPKRGYLLGALLLSISYLLFFGTRGREIFSAGPAASEYAFFLGLAALLALLTCLLVPSLRRPLGSRGRRAQRVSLGPTTGWLYLPQSTPPWPAVCALPPPIGSRGALDALASHLAKNGFATLVVEVQPSEAKAPDLFAIAPLGVSYLAKREDIIPERIALLGADLGGDMALRSAGEDEKAWVVVAISPLLEDRAPAGLEVLAEMSLGQGMRWRRLLKGGALVDQIGARQYLQKHNTLFVYGERDGLSRPPEGVEPKTIAAEGHLSLLHSWAFLFTVVDYLKENL